MMHGYGGYGWGMMGWGWILGLVILVTIIWFIAKVVNQNNMSQSKDKSAIDILKERYARGEIDKDEFDKRKKDLI